MVSIPRGSDRFEQDAADAASARSSARLVRTALRGVVGGLIATAVMTVYRLPVFRALPPTAEFWARYVGGGEAERYPLQGILLHLLYGGAAGGCFGLLFDRLGLETDVGRRRGGLVLGLGYGLLLSVVGERLVFERLLERDLEPDEALVFHVGHVVYGLTLGTWLPSRKRVGEVYE